MKIGTILEFIVTLYVVKMKGRCGDAERDCYFKTEEDAIFASAVEGQNLTPRPVEAMGFSDGTLMIDYVSIAITSRPSEQEIATLTKDFTPAQRLLLKKR